MLCVKWFYLCKTCGCQKTVQVHFFHCSVVNLLQRLLKFWCIVNEPSVMHLTFRWNDMSHPEGRDSCSSHHSWQDEGLIEVEEESLEPYHNLTDLSSETENHQLLFLYPFLNLEFFQQPMTTRNCLCKCTLNIDLVRRYSWSKFFLGKCTNFTL